MKIAVVICTWNRAASLERALTSIAQCGPPRRASWQVVVANNNCTDDTEAVIAAFRERLDIVGIFEQRQGLARARNAAIAAIDADYYVWTDDDVTVGADWLRAYEEAFERAPEAGFFGGPIRPCFEAGPPEWLRSALPAVLTAYAGLDLSDEETVLCADPHRMPFGANMAVRGAEQRAFPFDPDLGRQAAGYAVCGEETDVVRRIVDAGGVGVWIPEAAVDHWIAPERQSTEYLRNYYQATGYDRGRRAVVSGREMSWGLQARLRLRIALHDSVYLAGRLLRRPLWWVPALKGASRLRGALDAQWRLRSGRTRTTTG